MKKFWSLLLVLLLTSLSYADITPLPDPPSRTSPSTFAAKADAFLGALPAFATEANQLASDVNDDEVAAAASAAAALGYSNIALSSANFAGDWDDQAGAAAPPYAVWHAGNYWQLVNAVLDVSATEPGQTADWRVIGDKITVSTIADLRLISGVGVSSAYLVGHSSPEDGGHGVFYWDADSVLSDNGGTIVAVTGVATGRWIRQLNGFVTPEMFGAVTETDCYTQLRAAIDTLENVGGTLRLDPTKRYGISQELVIDTTKKITIISDGMSILNGYIYPTQNMAGAMIKVAKTSDRSVQEGVDFVGLAFKDPDNRSVDIDAALELTDWNVSVVDRCVFTSLKGSAITTDYCIMSDIKNCIIRLCGDTGKPALNIGTLTVGDAFPTQSLTIRDLVSEANYSAPYIQINGEGTGQLKIYGSRFESEQAIVATNQNFIKAVNVKNQVEVNGFHCNYNTVEAFYWDETSDGPIISNGKLNYSTPDGTPKIKIFGQNAVLENLYLTGGSNQNVTYDIELGDVGYAAYAQLNNIFIKYGAGIWESGKSQLNNIKLTQLFTGASVAPTGKYCLYLNGSGNSSLPSTLSNLLIDSPLTGNHGLYLGRYSSATNVNLNTIIGRGIDTANGTNYANINNLNAYSVSIPIYPTTPAVGVRISNTSGAGGIYKNSGAAATSSSTFVDVTHGCAFTPTLDKISVTPNANIVYWIDNINATTFRINVASSGSYTFGWTVEW